MDEFIVSDVEIVKIYRSDKGQNGQQFMSKKGNPFTKIDIYLDSGAVDDSEFQGKISYFDYFGNTDSWDIGTEISGTIVKKDVNGKTYFNFEMDKKRGGVKDNADIIRRLDRIERAVFGNAKDGDTSVKDPLDFSKKEDSVKDTLEFTKELMSDKKEEIVEDDLPF